MKRILLFFISFTVFASLLLSGCGEINRDNELKGVMGSIEDDLSDAFAEDTCEYGLFSDYIQSWAEASNVDVIYKGKSSTVILNEASPGCSKEPSTVLLCNLNTSSMSSSFKVLSTAMTSLIGPIRHGDISLVITEYSDGRYIGIDEVPVKYLKSDRLINLQASGSDTIITSGSNNAVASFRKSGSLSQPHYTNAYEITFSMSEYTDPYNYAKDKNYPDPINVIGSLLATAKSSGRLFEIASFTSSCNNGYTPYSAKAVVIIDDNNIESFTKKFEKSYENMNDRFDKVDDSFVYTMTECDMPDEVLSDSVSNNLISLMYMLNTGICIQDEETGTVEASSYIKSITTEDGDLLMQVDMRTRGESYLDSLSMEYETTAGLCSTGYSCSGHSVLWKSVSKSALVKYFTEKVPILDEAESNISIRTYENDIISKKLPDQNMIIYTFEKGNRKSALENITHFLDAEI